MTVWDPLTETDPVGDAWQSIGLMISQKVLKPMAKYVGIYCGRSNPAERPRY
jgi:hypothetical protein